MISTKKLPWMNISCLKHRLGNAKLTTTDDRLTKYTWHCPENSDLFLSAYVNKNQKLVKIEGEYSSANGSGIFSTVLNANPTPKIDLSNQQPVATRNMQTDDSCFTYFNQIKTSNKLPATDLAGLQQIFGQAQIQAMSEFFYQWDNYSLYVGPNGIRIQNGTLPNQSTASVPTLEDATRALGAPKKISKNTLNQYQWKCSADRNATLTVIADANGRLLSALGQSNTGSFSFDFA